MHAWLTDHEWLHVLAVYGSIIVYLTDYYVATDSWLLTMILNCVVSWRIILSKFAKRVIIVLFGLTALCKTTWCAQDIFVKKGHKWEHMSHHVALVSRTRLLLFWHKFLQHCATKFVIIFYQCVMWFVWQMFEDQINLYWDLNLNLN